MKKLKDINWNQVYCFYEVARKLSMKGAGELLGVSTPTVSEQIKRLEILLDTQLFRRFPRRLELTPEGEALFACARDMFEAGGRFLDLVSPSSIGGYATRVGLQDTSVEHNAVEFVDQYWDLFAPFGTVYTFRESHFELLVEKVLRGDLDWAVSLEKPRSPRLNFTEVGEFQIVFGCAPTILRKFKNPADILRAIPLARSSWDRILNEALDDYLRSNDIFPEEIIETDHREFGLSLARRGRCIIATTPRELGGMTGELGRELVTFHLGRPVKLSLYAFWLKASEKMISIRKLVELLQSKTPPETLNDPELQIRVADVPDDMLIADT